MARILKEKQPIGFILENVEGLVTHDRQNPRDKIGKTLTVILETLDSLGYQVSWRVLNAKDFGIAQERKRIYLVGSRKGKPDLDWFPCLMQPWLMCWNKGRKPNTADLLRKYSAIIRSKSSTANPSKTNAEAATISTVGTSP